MHYCVTIGGVVARVQVVAWPGLGAGEWLLTRPDETERGECPLWLR